MVCIICRVPDEKHQELLKYLTGEDISNYLYTLFMEPFYRYNVTLYNSYNLVAKILIGFSILAGFVIILNTTLTNLQEQKREIAVLFTLGFQHWEISRSRFRQTILQFLISVPIGLIAGTIMAKKMLGKIGSVNEDFFFASGIKEYAFTIIVVLVYLLICHFIAMHSMETWNISELVKDKE